MAGIRGCRRPWASRSTGAERATAVIFTWFVELGEEVRPASLLAHGRLHPLIPAIGECSGLEQPVPVDRDRIVLRNTLQVGPVAFSLPLKVTPQTQRVHLDEGRALARTRAMASPAATWTASTE